MTVVVTGGTGLLGRAVLERIAGMEEVVALCRLGTEPPDIAGVVWVEQDLTSPLDRRLPARADAVLSLAQSRRYREFPSGAVDTFEVNATATVKLLDYCRRCGAERFVHASSGNVYATGPEPLRESDHPDPKSLYEVSKLAAEHAARSYSDLFDVAVLRLFFVYGPLQDGGALIPGIVARVRTGRPIDLRGPDGLRTNPIHVADAARAVVHARERVGVGTVNVAGPEVIGLRQIGERVGELTGIRPEFARRPGGGADLIADLARMRERLPMPEIAPREGLAEMVGAGTTVPSSA